MRVVSHVEHECIDQLILSLISTDTLNIQAVRPSSAYGVRVGLCSLDRDVRLRQLQCQAVSCCAWIVGDVERNPFVWPLDSGKHQAPNRKCTRERYVGNYLTNGQQRSRVEEWSGCQQVADFQSRKP